MSALCESFVPAELPRVPSDTWIFGYGSLCCRPGFSYISSHPCYISGFVRRFYQASTDHRGTEENPGRVVTLVPASEEQDDQITADSVRTYGMAYLIHSDQVAHVLDYLTIREQGGYILCRVECHFINCDHPSSLTTQGASVSALTYIGTPCNPHYIGPAHVAHIAHQISKSHGPSGSNVEYLQQLYDWLNKIQRDDPHVTQIIHEVEKLKQQDRNSLAEEKREGEI